ncbi:hypothetical protein V5P93_007380 [Actinokineospora auranticolor]|uniref:Uncharacterized protein n=1 Tax=Actinokineospora auranticolor TaxID=155976 RepID=A0A2S6GS08_9PSEU|nr:hypothetical protein [Actinokineospora auranticolor]PPK68032.1 hypothetical protein CLV40_106265 [Actinokineospora auranticolor]
MRRLLGSATVTIGLLGAGFAGTGVAAADPLPFLAVDCAQQVVAFQGQPVRLARAAVAGFVTKAVRETPGLGLARSTAVGLSFPLGPAIEVGTVPDGTGEIPAAHIADVVAAEVRQVEAVAPAADAVSARVRELVAADCGMTLRALDASKRAPAPGKPTQPRADDPKAPDATTPNTQPVGGAPSAPEIRLYDPRSFPGAAARDYGTVPYAKAGHYVPAPDARYGAIPGYAPQFGILGSGLTDVRPAGEAYALPVTPVGAVGLPVVLAVLALSVVSGALVRTWVLRRTSPR